MDVKLRLSPQGKNIHEGVWEANVEDNIEEEVTGGWRNCMMIFIIFTIQNVSLD
jgi:hypothetical protein